MLAYAVSGLEQLIKRFRRLEVRIGSECFNCTLAVVSKSRLYGGQLVLTPQWNLLAPDCDVVCFRSGAPVVYTGYLASVVMHTIRCFPGVNRCQARTIELIGADPSAVHVQTEGELVGSLPATVRLGPERIKVLPPSPTSPRRGEACLAL